MLEVLMLFNLVIAGATAMADIALLSAVDTPLPQLQGVVKVEFREEPVSALEGFGLRDTSKFCKYTGVAVPFERTWEEVQKNSFLPIETVLPPEPGKIAGYALLVNKKQCPGKAEETMLRVATLNEAPTSRFKGTLMFGHQFVFQQLDTMHVDFRPKWLEQVTEVLAKAEATNSVAKQFLTETRQAAEAAKQAQAR